MKIVYQDVVLNPLGKVGSPFRALEPPKILVMWLLLLRHDKLERFRINHSKSDFISTQLSTSNWVGECQKHWRNWLSFGLSLTVVCITRVSITLLKVCSAVEDFNFHVVVPNSSSTTRVLSDKATEDVLEQHSLIGALLIWRKYFSWCCAWILCVRHLFSKSTRNVGFTFATV